MAENQKSPTQQATAPVANKFTAGAGNTTPVNPATVQQAAERRAAGEPIPRIQLPDPLANGGAKK